MSWGDDLRDRREAAGASLDLLADRAGIGREDLKALEAGAKPTPDVQAAIDAALTSPAEELS